MKFKVLVLALNKKEVRHKSLPPLFPQFFLSWSVLDTVFVRDACEWPYLCVCVLCTGVQRFHSLVFVFSSEHISDSDN